LKIPNVVLVGGRNVELDCEMPCSVEFAFAVEC
jgi:hypothetical protein